MTKEPVYFTNGIVIEKEYFYFTSKVKSIDHTEHTHSRLFFSYNEEWFHHDLNNDIISICIKSKNKKEVRKYFALDSNGEIEIQYPNNVDLEKIETDNYGALKDISEIGSHLYTCGDQGQVYKRIGANNWIHFDNGILEKNISAKATDLNCIDGFDEKNIYTVGYNGKIYFNDGIQWKQIPSQTTEHLEKVICLSNQEVYICGNNGTLLKGNFNGFENISDKNFTINIWDIAMFNNVLYLATLEGLFVLNDNSITPLKTGLKPEIKGFRLDTKDKVLLSIGVDDLALFDGKKWKRIIHPDNT